MENGDAEPRIKTHTFDAVISNTPVTFHVIHMNNCLFLWIGDQGTFDSLSVAMATHHSPHPISTVLLGHSAEDNSSGLAARISRKTGKQVFASCNLTKGDGTLLVGITERLMRELKDNPDKF